MRERSLIQRCVCVRRGAGGVLLVWLLAVWMFGVIATSSSLWDRDEPRFARAAVEMRDSGDGLVPRFNHDLRPDKPILIYWLMCGGLWLLGFGELAVRLPSVLAVPTAGAVTYVIARQLLSWDAHAPPPSPPEPERSAFSFEHVDAHRVGLWSMVILLTALVPIYIGTAATADGVLLLCITASVSLLIEAARRQSRRLWLACGVALGLAQLTKGPVALGIVGLMAIAMMVFGWRRLGLNRRFALGLGTAMVISLAMFAAWGWPANLATDGELARQGLGRHVGERMVTAMEGHGGEGALEYLALLPAYIPMLMIGLGGWVSLLPLGAREIVRRGAGFPVSRRVVLCWFLPGFVLFSLVATKLPHYVLPLYPAVAVWLAIVIETHPVRAEHAPGRVAWWRRLGGWFYLGGSAVLSLGMLTAPWALGRPDLGWSLLGPGLVTAATAVAGVVWIYRGQVKRAGVMIALGTAAVLVLMAGQTFRVVEEHLKPAPEIAAAVRERWGERADTLPIRTKGYNEPSVVFYLNRPADEPVKSFDELVEPWQEAAGPGVLIITEARLRELGVASAEAWGERVSVLKRIEVINYADSAKAKTILVLSREAAAADDRSSAR